MSHSDTSNGWKHPFPHGPASKRFPLRLCAAGIIATSLGLAAAALDLRWSASPQPGDALQTAWVNVNLMLTLVYLLLWPAFVLRNKSAAAAQNSPSTVYRINLLWDFATLAAAAIPALGLAAFLSGITASMIAAMLSLQAGVGIFVLGLLALCAGRGAWEVVAVALTTSLAVAAPIAIYLWSEFFGLASNSWCAAIPAVAVVRAAHETAGSTTTFIAACLYALFGIILCVIQPTRAAIERRP